MINFIRSTTILSLVFLIALFSACGVSTAEQQTNVKRQPPAQILSDKPKIVAFGDSLTAGFGLTEKESYPYLLQEKLNADGYKYEVINAGVSGETSLRRAGKN